MRTLRWLHKWIGLILGLQFVLWTLSGAVMAQLDQGKVAARGAILAQAEIGAPGPLLPIAELADLAGAPILKLKLRPLMYDYVYEVTTPQGVRLLDARDGRRVVVDAARARNLAVASFAGFEPVSSVTRVDESTLESRAFKPPVWRVEFADKVHTTLFVSPASGEVLGARNDSWRMWDMAWMVHIMDYSKRENFNHPLIITVASAVAWLAMSGFILLFGSFRRRDVAWVLSAVDRIQGKASGRGPAGPP